MIKITCCLKVTTKFSKKVKMIQRIIIITYKMIKATRC